MLPRGRDVLVFARLRATAAFEIHAMLTQALQGGRRPGIADHNRSRFVTATDDRYTRLGRRGQPQFLLLGGKPWLSKARGRDFLLMSAEGALRAGLWRDRGGGLRHAGRRRNLFHRFDFAPLT